ncbi:GDSL esterase/lipase At1g23500-like [Mercurialis annua]|uniref:GDSL esterase/lipase At1g23500-like n=1 Tax=Mercurialis annua TaxID=3986 RepID=UPI00215E0CFC|nr:GDSL esterase/lipase At1g23500-like [Mercurialis annua]
MKMETNSYVVLLIVYMLVLICRIEGSNNGTISAVIAFGDSILDTGNNNNLKTMSKCNYMPYGRDFPGGLPTGRFGNGKVFSDLMAEGLGVKELLPAYLDPNLQDEDLPTGVCFASGGTGFDPITSGIQNVIPPSQQLDNFKEYLSRLQNCVGKDRADEIIANAQFLISFGNNDLAITYFGTHLRLTQDIPAYTSQLVSMASTFVNDIYALGARRIGFLGTLPLGCLPSATGRLMCLENVNEAAQLFNSKLSSEMTNLNQNLNGAKIFYIDVYTPLLEIIRDPPKSGFLVANVGCCCQGLMSCPLPETNVFWDYGHPSEKAYKIIISQLLQNSASNFS